MLPVSLKRIGQWAYLAARIEAVSILAPVVATDRTRRLRGTCDRHPMYIHFSDPELLWGLPFCALPLLASMLRKAGYPSLDLAPRDWLSSFIRATVALAGMMAIAAIIVAASRPYLGGGVEERQGSGAQIVLLLDRSSSMDLPFDENPGKAQGPSKRKIAVELLRDFVGRSEHHRFGVISFSTMPAVALPITDDRAATLAAINAMDRPGIDGTNIGLGLAAGVDLIDGTGDTPSPAIILVSDGQFGGAGHFQRDLKQQLGAALKRQNAQLYWLFLRPAADNDVLGPPPPGEADTSYTRPERHMNIFFGELGVPYRLFQAGDPEAIEKALSQIKSLAARPITYRAPVPRTDLGGYFYALSAICALLLVLAKFAEIDMSPTRGGTSRPAFGDPRFWLLLGATGLLIATLTRPNLTRTVDAFRLLVTIDITRSMNARDIARAGGAVSRLDGIKSTLHSLLPELSCGSEIGLALFAERRSFLLFEPIEVCSGYSAIDGAVSGLGWRMAWSGDSYIARGLFDAIQLGRSLRADVVFFTDGQEAPPLPATGGPRFEADPRDVRGLIVGVGGEDPAPIPKFDDNGREIGFLEPDDVEHENRVGLPTKSVADMMEGANARNAPFGASPATGQEHLTSVKRSYLEGLARETGLAYADLTTGRDLGRSLAVSATPHPVDAAVDLRPALAAAALVLLALAYLLNWARHLGRRVPRVAMQARGRIRLAWRFG